MTSLVIFGAASCLTTIARAQDDPGSTTEAPSSADIKKAADSYDQGRERFRDGNYTEAAEMFEAADDYAPNAAALRLAMASRKEAGQLDRASTLAALALERHPDETELKNEAEALLSESTSGLAKLNVNCDTGCELTLNNRLVHGRAALSRILYVEPGKLTIRASWSEGRTESEKVKVEAGDFREVSFYTPPVEAGAAAAVASTEPSYDEPSEAEGATESERKKGWSPAVFWTGTALTVAGVGASAVLGVRALNHPGKDAVTESCEEGDTTCPEYREGKKNQTIANVAIGATAAVGLFTIITGIWLTDWGGDKAGGDQAQNSHPPSRGFTVRPIVSVGQGAFLGAHGTF